MTVEKVSIKPRRIELTGDGVLTDFDFDFKIFAEGDVTVYLRDLSDVSVLQTITTDYTVAFNSEAETGTISFVTPPTNLFIVLMISAADYEQQTDIPKGGGFSEPVVEKGYDLLAIQIQQLREDLDRAVTLSETSPLTSAELPDPAVADAPIGWDPTGTFLVNNPASTNLSQIDTAATPDFIGASAGDGVLRTGASLSYTDGGDFVTLNTIQDITSGASPTFDGANITGIDAVNVDIADSGALITATDVEGALAENRGLIDTNTAKVSNATHDTDVTGDVTLTIAPVAITNKPAATVASGDLVLVADIDAANALKQVTAQSIADLGAGGGPIEIFDEGGSLTATASSIDFVGAGVVATNVGSAVTVTIAGGGAAPEGTAVLSTGEVGAVKFLREDGDNSSSWQAIPTHTGDVTGDTALTIAAKAVDVAMLADGTDGELVTWDAAGVAATVPVGTVGQVLTSGGAGVAPTFQAAGGGSAPAYEFVQSGTFSTVSTVAITQTLALDDDYKIIYIGRTIGGSADIQPVMRVANDSAGSNYRSTNWGQDGATAWNTSHAAANEIRLLNAGTEHQLLAGMFHIEVDVIHRDAGVVALSYVVASLRGSPATAPMKSSGVGIFNGGPNPPLTLELIRIAGTDTMTGRYYVYKLATA